MAKKRLKQQALPGMEQPKVPAVEKAAARYVYGKVVEITAPEKVKVRGAADPDDESEGDDEGA